LEKVDNAVDREDDEDSKEAPEHELSSCLSCFAISFSHGPNETYHAGKEGDNSERHEEYSYCCDDITVELFNEFSEIHCLSSKTFKGLSEEG
jgi:hypothetical protein